MSMQKHIKAIMQILQDLGITTGIVERGAKHVKVLIEGPLGTRKIIASSSPSDHRAMLNFRSDLRRLAREIGAIQA